MRIISLQIGRNSFLLTSLFAVTAGLLAHIFCIIPIILVPLGLSGAGTALGEYSNYLQLGFSGLAILILGFNGWRIYSKPRGALFEKFIFWVAVGIVSIILFYPV